MSCGEFKFLGPDPVRPFPPTQNSKKHRFLRISPPPHIRSDPKPQPFDALLLSAYHRKKNFSKVIISTLFCKNMHNFANFGKKAGSHKLESIIFVFYIEFYYRRDLRTLNKAFKGLKNQKENQKNKFYEI